MEIRLIAADDTLALRQAVLWPDLPLAELRVEGDADALHLGAFDGARMVGTGSFYIDDARARLRKLAVLPEAQGRGVGAAVVVEGAARLRRLGVAVLWCDARVSALGFYERLGFEVSGPEFDKGGIAYRVAEWGLDRASGNA